MVSWQLTATTIMCERSGHEVTITVFRDGKLACTGTYASPARKTQSACKAQECTQVEAYRVKLLAEEEHG
jgi:hypothetical protein